MYRNFKRGYSSLHILLVITVLSIATTACNTSWNEVVPALDAALQTLVKNKSLVEQFVRDAKTTLDPKDPAYEQLVESYDDARDAYNRFLNAVELAAKTNSRRDLDEDIQDVQNKTADFLAISTRSLEPTMNTRRIPFRSAVVLPEELADHLNKLPKKYRSQMIDRLDDQLRWRTWREL